MKKIFTLSACVLTAFSINAQITLNQSDYASWTPSNDSFRSLTQFSVMPSANATWDLSTATYTPGTYWTFKSALNNPGLPDATYSIDSYYPFSSFQYYSDIAYGINVQGLNRYGEVITRQAFSLGAATMNPLDSLVFPDQLINYSGPRKILQFPATLGANWSSNYTYQTDFEITIAAYALTNVPGYRSSRVTTTDSVIGWGKIRVLDADDQPSAYMDVLAVKSFANVSDSFYLGGNPAPPQLLTAFNLQQGQNSPTYRIAYYRAGEVDPLLVVSYTDASYSTADKAATHASRLASSPSGISFVVSSADMTIYPNPALDGTIHIVTGSTSPSHQLSYALINLNGQKMAEGAINSVSGQADIRLNATYTGLHYLKLFRDGKLLEVKPVVLQ